jgi:NTP pyrophosphatase (non-canonical NTP hydrolase)
MMENSPINTLQQLMAITAEECGELTQVCMKVIRRHDQIDQLKTDEKYKQKLLEEVGDVYCMIDLMIDHGLLDEDQIYQRAQIKREKLKTWSTLINE